MKIFRIFFYFIIFSISRNVFADHIPNACPSVENLKQEAFASATCHVDGLCYISQPISKYDTEENWSFTTRLDADSLQDSIQKANEMLPTLSYQSGPTKIRDRIYKCRYGNGFGYIAEAIYQETSQLAELSEK